MSHTALVTRVSPRPLPSPICQHSSTTSNSFTPESSSWLSDLNDANARTFLDDPYDQNSLLTDSWLDQSHTWDDFENAHQLDLEDNTALYEYSGSESNSNSLCTIGEELVSLDVLVGLCPDSDISRWKSPLFSRFLPAIDRLLRRIGVFTDNIPWFSTETPGPQNNAQLLGKQSISLDAIGFVISRLVNGKDSLNSIVRPITTSDQLCHEGVKFLFSLPPHELSTILDATPSPYNIALEQGLFSVAVDMGAWRVVEIMLKRNINVNEPINLDGRRWYPLERSCLREFIEVKRILLAHGADPNKYVHDYPLCTFLVSTYYPDKDLPNYLQTIDLLLSHHATMDPGRYSTKNVLNSCKLEVLQLLFDSFAASSYRMFISNAGLAIILGRTDLGDLAFTAVVIILQNACLDTLRDGYVWNNVLRASLSNAARNGYTEAIDHLLIQGATPTTNCLINSVNCKDVNVFERFLDLGLDPNSLSEYEHIGGSNKWGECQSYGTTALSACIRYRFAEGYQMLHERGLVLKAADNQRSLELALEEACRVRNQDIFDCVLSIQKSEWTLEGHGVLTTAARWGQESIILKLLAAGIIPGQSALQAAMRTRQPSVVRLLIDIVDLSPDHDSQGLLVDAIFWGNMDVINDLMQAHVPLNCTYSGFNLSSELEDLNRVFNNGDRPIRDHPCPRSTTGWQVTPLSAAIFKGNMDVVELLLVAGAQINRHHVCNTILLGGSRWLTPLAASAAKRDLVLLQHLLDRGADPFDNDALDIATRFGEEHIILALLDAFLKRYPHGDRSFGVNALLWAISADATRIVEILVPSVHFTGLVPTSLDYLMSPLGMAIYMDNYYSDFSMLDMIVQKSGDFDSVVKSRTSGASKKTALLYAIELDSFEAVKKLTKAGANVKLPASKGLTRTPLQAASEAGNEKMVDFFLQQGAEPNETPAVRAGATALQFAAMHGFLRIATTLLKAGADVNAEPAKLDGRTAFEGAAEHGRIDMMLLLVQNGADLLSDDQRQYQRAIEFAEKNGNTVAKQFAGRLFEALWKQKSSPILEGEVSGNGPDPGGIFSDSISLEG